jgi:hypothetical protein
MRKGGAYRALSGLRQCWPLLTTILLTALGAVLATWPLARHLGSAALRDGEVLLTAWQLNWFQHALLTNPLAWADANIFFPYANAATFNDLLLTHAVVTLPAAWADSPVLALNLAFLGGIVLCGVCAYALVVELTGNRWAAAVAGTLFALAPFRFLHLGHLSIAAAWAIPLFVWTLLRHFRSPSWGAAIAAVVSGLAVSCSSLYHAAYLAPVLPFVVWFGWRRGPGGRAVWLPLVTAAFPGLALLAWVLSPFLATMETFGVAAAPDDLVRFGADLTSLTARPEFIGGSAPAHIDDEAQLYPGAGLGLLAMASALLAMVTALEGLRGWRRHAMIAALAVFVAVAAAWAMPPTGVLRSIWSGLALVLIWAAPIVLMARAIAGAPTVTPAAALQFGLAGAAWTFALSLGPEARFLGERIGPAPYALLAAASSAFEGTRVPARFGGLSLLFLSVAVAGGLAWASSPPRPRALAGVASVLALLACFSELPIPPLPAGRPLVAVDQRAHVDYGWLRDAGDVGVLELPDWRASASVSWQLRQWRALRYMLTSKQHYRHLVNGTGRIEPFLWTRLRSLDPLSEPFYRFIEAYFPVKYVVFHEDGFPSEHRDQVWAAIAPPSAAWREVSRAQGMRVFEVNRSAGRGPIVDRILLRRAVTPRVAIAFAARAEVPAGATATVELLRDGDVVATWTMSAGWATYSVEVPVSPVAPAIYRSRCAPRQAPCAGWPDAGTLLRWRLSSGEGEIEIRDLSFSAPN